MGLLSEVACPGELGETEGRLGGFAAEVSNKTSIAAFGQTYGALLENARVTRVRKAHHGSSRTVPPTAQHCFSGQPSLSIRRVDAVSPPLLCNCKERPGTKLRTPGPKGSCRLAVFGCRRCCCGNLQPAPSSQRGSLHRDQGCRDDLGVTGILSARYPEFQQTVFSRHPKPCPEITSCRLALLPLSCPYLSIQAKDMNAQGIRALVPSKGYLRENVPMASFCSFRSARMWGNLQVFGDASVLAEALASRRQQGNRSIKL